MTLCKECKSSLSALTSFIYTTPTTWTQCTVCCCITPTTTFSGCLIRDISLRLEQSRLSSPEKTTIESQACHQRIFDIKNPRSVTEFILILSIWFHWQDFTGNKTEFIMSTVSPCWFWSWFVGVCISAVMMTRLDLLSEGVENEMSSLRGHKFHWSHWGSSSRHRKTSTHLKAELQSADH